MNRAMSSVLFFSATFFVLSDFCSSNDEIIKRLDEVTVTIIAEDGSGSGVLVRKLLTDKDGKQVPISFVWTAAHVVEGNLKATKDGIKQIPVTLVKRIIDPSEQLVSARAVIYKISPKYDLAILLVLGDAQYSSDFPLPQDLAAEEIGTDVYTVGSPHRLINMFSKGIISRTGYKIEGTNYDHIDAHALPGSSGGGVFRKSDGACIGIISRIMGDGIYTLMVPFREMLEFADSQGVGWIISGNNIPSYEDAVSETLGLDIKEVVTYEIDFGG